MAVTARGEALRWLAWFVVAGLWLGASVAWAQSSDPQDFAWQQRAGAQVPLDVAFRETTGGDEAGHGVRLGDVLGKRPVILDLGYFHCPGLCGTVRADLINALAGSGLSDSQDYTLVALSIDPAETPKDAVEAKDGDLKQASFTQGGGWHYLTGGAAAIDAVKSAVGFRDRYDASYKQFLHPAGLVVLTRQGVVSNYLLGVGYSAGDLRAAVLRGGEGGVAQAALPVLLLCFHFDSVTGRYTLAIVKVLRLMGVLTILTLGGLMIVLHRQRPQRPPNTPP